MSLPDYSMRKLLEAGVPFGHENVRTSKPFAATPGKDDRGSATAEDEPNQTQ